MLCCLDAAHVIYATQFPALVYIVWYNVSGPVDVEAGEVGAEAETGIGVAAAVVAEGIPYSVDFAHAASIHAQAASCL